MEKLDVQTSLIDMFSGPADLLAKIEYEGNQLLHTRDERILSYTLFNFCVSSHAMRDWVLKHLKIPDAEHSSYHEKWNTVRELALVRDIANSTKHFGLDHGKKSIAAGVQEVAEEYVSFYSAEDFKNSRSPELKKSLSVILSDGSLIALHDLVRLVYREWLNFFAEHGIPHSCAKNEVLLFVNPAWLERAKSFPT